MRFLLFFHGFLLLHDLQLVVLLVNLLLQLLPVVFCISKPFGVQFTSIVLEEHVILMDPDFDVLEVSHVRHVLAIALEQLVLVDASLLHGHDQLLAVAHYVVGEVSPLKLRLIEHSFGVSFFLLQNDHVLLHLLQSVRQGIVFHIFSLLDTAYNAREVLVYAIQL